MYVGRVLIPPIATHHFLASFLYRVANHSISAKHASGTMKPAAIESSSAMKPISTGAIAPPTIDITRYDEACGMYAHVAQRQ